MTTSPVSITAPPSRLASTACCSSTSRPKRRRRASRIAAGISGGLVLAGLGALYFWPGSSGTLWELSRVLHGELSDEFGSHRGQIWKQAWQRFLERPWLGSGPGTASERLDIRWSRWIEALGRERVVSVGNTHNVFLGHLLCEGILGGGAYLAAAACSLATWYRRRRAGALFPALGSAFLCYMIQDFFGIGLCLTTPMLWVVWGLLESVCEEAERPAEAAKGEKI